MNILTYEIGRLDLLKIGIFLFCLGVGTPGGVRALIIPHRRGPYRMMGMEPWLTACKVIILSS